MAAAFAICAPPAAALAPSDAFFPRQWGDSNTGQLVPSQDEEEVLGPETKGTPGADDRALEAWRASTGSRSIVIGELDTGVDYRHPDLAANIWSNPGGVGGCPSATHGYNVLAKSCEPIDTEPLNASKGQYGGHGTHVAGIMAAIGNNSIGVAGMSWQATVLPVKWLQTAGEDQGVARLIEALKWVAKAAREGVDIRVVNDSPSFRGTPSAQQIAEETNAIGELAAENILFVTAAGNTGEDNDAPTGRYPCRLGLANELCVTATDNRDQLPEWADFGPHTVDLAAPGVSIYSTLREARYGYLSGGSMAAAQVSGAAALILSVEPSLSAVALKQDILASVDPLPSLAGLVESGGRLDVCRALPGCEPPSVSGVSPSSGSAAGGTSVTISGAHLDGATSVAFGSAAASSFTVNSPTSITATSPPGAGTVDVTVTNAGGTSPAVAGDRFTYVAEASSGSSSPAGTAAVLGTSANRSGVLLVRSTLPVRSGKATVKLRCSGARRCVGTLTIRVKRLMRRRGGGTKTVLQTIGQASYSLASGRSGSIVVSLNRTGRALLRHSRAALAALLTIRPTGPGASHPTTRRVQLVRVRSGSTKKSAS